MAETRGGKKGKTKQGGECFLGTDPVAHFSNINNPYPFILPPEVKQVGKTFAQVFEAVAHFADNRCLSVAKSLPHIRKAKINTQQRGS